MAKKNNTVFVEDRDQILAFVESRSITMYEHILNSNSEFTLWYKSLTHSDLTTRGKRSGKDQGLEKNYLYYLSVDEMKQIQELTPEKEYASAKQSNITMPEKFYNDLGIKRLERRKGKQNENHKHVKLNDTVDVLIVNDTMDYFKLEYTNKVLENLNKDKKITNDSEDIHLNKEEKFTKIQLTEAIHGLGTSSDTEFHKLRLSMFMNDIIIFLIEHREERNVLYIMLDKNPRFYTIVGIADTAWEQYLTNKNRQEKFEIQSKSDLKADEFEKSRKLQSAWKFKLAQEMMTYEKEEGKVFCPFTMIKADFNAFSMLFVASHIKRHADCSSDKESFDINNGLLLCANADALFDKYMITINENKEFEYSFLLKDDYVLRQQLQIQSVPLQYILNDYRMKNLKKHRERFIEKEKERMKSMGA